jgi:hypothetical protein
MQREVSDNTVNLNKNVNWMESRGFWSFYILLLSVIYMSMPFFVAPEDAWTGVNIVHGIVSKKNKYA